MLITFGAMLSIINVTMLPDTHTEENQRNTVCVGYYVLGDVFGNLNSQISARVTISIIKESSNHLCINSLIYVNGKDL